MNNTIHTLDTAMKLISKYYSPKIDSYQFAINIINAAEIDYLKDKNNSLYKDDQLDIDVFDAWLSLQNLEQFDC